MKEAKAINKTRIRYFRELKGWSQRQLATLLITSEDRISRWERGLLKPSLHFQLKLCEVFEVGAIELGLVEEQSHHQRTQHIIPDMPLVKEVDVNPRRHALQHLLASMCTTMFLGSQGHIDQFSFLQDQIQKRRSQRMDSSIVQSLRTITTEYWKLSSSVSIDILEAVSGTLSALLATLSHQSQKIQQELIVLAAENAHIIGKILSDTCDYSLSWSYFSLSNRLAHEAGHPSLQATGWGHLALILLMSQQEQEALQMLQTSRQLVQQDAFIHSWLCALEAEAHAALGNQQESMMVLKLAEEHTSSQDQRYAIRFTDTRLKTFQGVCALKLKQSEQAFTHFKSALDNQPDQQTRQRTRLLVDLSKTCVQVEDWTSARQYAMQALDQLAQNRSSNVLYRLEEAFASLPKQAEIDAVRYQIGIVKQEIAP